MTSRNDFAGHPAATSAGRPVLDRAHAGDPRARRFLPAAGLPLLTPGPEHDPGTRELPLGLGIDPRVNCLV
jgi:hypothetical protein